MSYHKGRHLPHLAVLLIVFVPGLIAAPVATAGPDLEIVLFSAPANATRGEPIGHLITLIVRNRGDAPISAPIVVGFYTSADAEITTQDVLLIGGREQISGGLAAGATATVPLFSGAHIRPEFMCGVTENPYIGVIVDEFNSIPEDDETNNTASSSVVLTGCPVSTNQTSWGRIKSLYRSS